MTPIAATKLPEDALADVIHRRVTVLGSTGSIGVNTLDVIAHARKIHGAHAFPITALTAGGNVKLLIEQALALKPKRAVSTATARSQQATSPTPPPIAGP